DEVALHGAPLLLAVALVALLVVLEVGPRALQQLQELVALGGAGPQGRQVLAGRRGLRAVRLVRGGVGPVRGAGLGFGLGVAHGRFPSLLHRPGGRGSCRASYERGSAGASPSRRPAQPSFAPPGVAPAPSPVNSPLSFSKKLLRRGETALRSISASSRSNSSWRLVKCVGVSTTATNSRSPRRP